MQPYYFQRMASGINSAIYNILLLRAICFRRDKVIFGKEIWVRVTNMLMLTVYITIIIHNFLLIHAEQDIVFRQL